MSNHKNHILPKTSARNIGQGASAGRPKIDIEKYFKMILPFLQNGFSVSGACKAAGVPRTTITDYMKKDEEFSSKIKVAQRTLEILARDNIGNKIKEGDVVTARWYLERKCREEFGLQTKNTYIDYTGDVIII